MLRQRIQLACLHVAVTMTAVPIQSALARVMIRELALPATLVAVLAAFPYIFSPLQVAIGSFTDRHPVAGRRRSPAIVLGLFLCAAGLALSPLAAYALPGGGVAGLALSLLSFGAWGIGFNLASVSYFSLAAELSGEKGRSRTIAMMFFLMIVGIIVTSIVLSRMLDPYSPAVLARAFLWIAGAALALGLAGLVGLEGRGADGQGVEARITWRARLEALGGNRHARLFFVYLLFLLVAILGQDVLLAPFGGVALGMSVKESTGITSVWGTFTLIGLVVAGLLEGVAPKRLVAAISSWAVVGSYLALLATGLLVDRGLFYAGVSVLGLATGTATVANLSLMLDMTVIGRVGLFMGAWGMADALARLAGNLLSGAVRDLVSQLSGDPTLGFVCVFALLAAMTGVSLVLLGRIDVEGFAHRATAVPRA